MTSSTRNNIELLYVSVMIRCDVICYWW